MNVFFETSLGTAVCPEHFQKGGTKAVFKMFYDPATVDVAPSRTKLRAQWVESWVQVVAVCESLDQHGNILPLRTTDVEGEHFPLRRTVTTF